jgi:hypothetical protein
MDIDEVQIVKQFAYPNPAKTTIYLPYQLKLGETSVMHIYNAYGQLIETKKIDATFNTILLNVSNYSKGVYIFEVNGAGNKFVVEWFSQCMCMEKSGCQMTPSKGKERLKLLSVAFRFASSLLHQTNTFKHLVCQA